MELYNSYDTEMTYLVMDLGTATAARDVARKLRETLAAANRQRIAIPEKDVREILHAVERCSKYIDDLEKKNETLRQSNDYLNSIITSVNPLKEGDRVLFRGTAYGIFMTQKDDWAQIMTIDEDGGCLAIKKCRLGQLTKTDKRPDLEEKVSALISVLSINTEG